MEIEYSNEVKGKVFAYRLTTEEQEVIAESLIPHIKKLNKQIERIENNPKNEGQATYSCQIDDLRSKVKDFQYIIDTFKS